MNALVPTPALQSHLDAQVTLLTNLANRMVDAMQRLATLNITYAQQWFQDWLDASRHLLASSDPVELGAAAAACGMPASEHMRNYQQQLLNTLAGAQAELTRAAEQHMPEASRAVSAIADDVVRRSTEATQRLAAEQRNVMERMGAAIPNGHARGAPPPAAPSGHGEAARG